MSILIKFMHLETIIVVFIRLQGAKMEVFGSAMGQNPLLEPRVEGGVFGPDGAGFEAAPKLNNGA
jgi:hypothetical protein